MTRLYFSVYSETEKGAVLIFKEARTQPEAEETVSAAQPAVAENANQHEPPLQQNLKQPLYTLQQGRLDCWRKPDLQL